MKTLATLFVVIIAVSSLSIKEQRLKAMNKLTYTSMFVEISNQITSGGPLTSILDTIEKFDSDIRTEQAEHDAMWAIQSADCEEEKAFRAGEIKDGTEAFGRAQKHYNTCSASLDRATVDLANCKKDQVDTQSAKDQITAIREAEHAAYVDNMATHHNAITIIEDAIDFLDEMVAGEASLLQLSQRTMEIIRVGTKARVMGSVAPLVTMFAQMAASEEDDFVDQGAIERCKGMMQEILSTCKANMEAADMAEQDAQAVFNSVNANLEATLRELDVLEGRLSGHVDDMNACVLEEDIVMTAAQAKVVRNTEMLEVANAMCDSFEHEYNTATEQRNEERDLLSIIKQMAEKRMVKYRDATSTGTVSGVDDFGGIDYDGADYTATSDEWE